jgi:hypothetical protein
MTDADDPPSRAFGRGQLARDRRRIDDRPGTTGCIEPARLQENCA